MSRAESIEVLFPLMDACKAGDLEKVAGWIAAGKPIDPPEGKRSRRRSPLEIAIERGFLTLTKNLLKGGADPCANGNALEFAVQCNRVDHARALIDHGVDVRSVSFASVCWRESPEMIRLFIERGADVTTNAPLYGARIDALLHPPTPKKSAASESGKVATPELSADQIQARAEEWLLTMCVEGGPRPFHQSSYAITPTPRLVRSRLGLAKEDKRDPYPFLEKACAAVSKRLTTAKVSSGAETHSRGAITVALKDHAEWLDLFREVNPTLGAKERYWLGSAGQQLLESLEAGQFPAEPVDEATLKTFWGRRTPEKLAEWLSDVSVRTDGEVGFEASSDSNGQVRFRMWRDKNARSNPRSKPLNPVCDVNFEHLRKDDFDATRVLLQRAIQDLQPSGTKPVTVYAVATRSELHRCFPKLSFTRSEDFAFYLRTLLDEINERTPFVITSYSYTEYTSAKTKLKLASKPSDLDLVVRQLQWLGLQQGKLVAREAAVQAITAFLAQAPASSSAAT